MEKFQENVYLKNLEESVTVSFQTDALYNNEDLLDFDIQTGRAYSVERVNKENDKEYLYLEDPRGNNLKEMKLKLCEDSIVRVRKEIAEEILYKFEIPE